MKISVHLLRSPWSSARVSIWRFFFHFMIQNWCQIILYPLHTALVNLTNFSSIQRHTWQGKLFLKIRFTNKRLCNAFFFIKRRLTDVYRPHFQTKHKGEQTLEKTQKNGWLFGLGPFDFFFVFELFHDWNMCLSLLLLVKSSEKKTLLPNTRRNGYRKNW